MTMAFAPQGHPLTDETELNQYLTKHRLVPTISLKRDASLAEPATNADGPSPEKRPLLRSLLAASSSSSLPLTPVGSQAQLVNVTAVGSSSSSVSVGFGGGSWRCRLCGFTHSRLVRVRYHVICRHLKSKPFSCPYCRLYLWKVPRLIHLSVRFSF